MEQAQLYKRLFTISVDELAMYHENSRSVADCIKLLNISAKQRTVIRHAQLEDFWQEEVEGKWEFFVKMKLASSSLTTELALKNNLNMLEWHIVYQRYSDLAAADKPFTFLEYAHKPLRVEIIDIGVEYGIAEACAVLDHVYEFGQKGNVQQHTKH